MLTSAGRMAMAERLRMDVSEEECIDYAVFRIIKDVLGIDGASGAKAARILADLIDPTCHDFGGEEGTKGEWYDFACSACGYVGDLDQPRYCPNCGARVMRDPA